LHLHIFLVIIVLEFYISLRNFISITFLFMKGKLRELRLEREERMLLRTK
jgi:hypothetical protein